MYTLFIFLFVTIPVQILSIVIMPFILPFIPASRETLPVFVRWFDNAEIPLGINAADDGLAGPAYYRVEALAQYKKFLFSDYLSLLLCRYIWLCFRNPINYFQYKVIGAYIEPQKVTIVDSGDPRVGNKEGDIAGTSHMIVTVGNKRYYDYYKVIKLWKGRCLRIRLGWKLSKLHIEGYKQFVCTFNLAAYEGV